MSSIGSTWAYPPPAAPPFIPKTGPRLGSRNARTAGVLPSGTSQPSSRATSLIPSARPIEVVVFPSPAGVGLIAVTRMSLAGVVDGVDESAASRSATTVVAGTFALSWPKGMISSTLRPSLAAIDEIGRTVALRAISKSMLIVIMFTQTVFRVL